MRRSDLSLARRAHELADWPGISRDLRDELERLADRVEQLERRPIGGTWCCFSCWRAAGPGNTLAPPITCPTCGSADCPKATAHPNRCQGPAPTS